LHLLRGSPSRLRLEPRGRRRARSSSLNPGFDELFSRGIDPDVDDPTQCHAHPDVPDTWPALDEVLAYRDRLRATLRESVELVSARGGRELMARDGRVFTMIIEHELMHQETLLYMMQRLDLSLKVRPDWVPPVPTGLARRPAMVHVPGGPVTLGAGLAELGFAWDNESPSHEVVVPGFRIDETPVTNEQFLTFVED